MPGKRKHEGSVERPLEDKADIGGNNKAAGETLSVVASASGPLARIKPRICVPCLLPAIPLRGARGLHATKAMLSEDSVAALLQTISCQIRRRSVQQTQVSGCR